jgi:hypothetical protein
MQKISANLFAEIIAVVVPTATAHAQQPNAISASCLDIAVTLIFLDSLHATLNEVKIAANSTILRFTNLTYDCHNFNQGLTDYLYFGDFTQ